MEKTPEIKIKQAMQLVKEGKSYRQAARAIKVHNCTIERYAKKLGIRSPHAEAIALRKNLEIIKKEAKPSLWQRFLKWLEGV